MCLPLQGLLNFRGGNLNMYIEHKADDQLLCVIYVTQT